MKRRLVLALAVVALMVAAFSGTALAKEKEIGTPGDLNCKGQTTAWVAQGAGGASKERGFANVAKDLGFTVQELHDIIDEFCAGP
ncbi:MAG: hypothetical protein FJ320_03050 [SAR202 cluster bacterium]|nr:hypothetical protein [SAR202 cluster bacterium]